MGYTPFPPLILCQWELRDLFFKKPRHVSAIPSPTPFFFGGGVFCLLGRHLWHMEVPRPGVKSELQLSAYTTATQDPSHICELHHSSQ